MDAIQKKTGRPGVPDKKILEAVESVVAKGMSPTVDAVQSISGGSRQRVGEILAQRRLVLHGTMSAPPVPVVVAKALNEHFEAIRLDLATKFKTALDAAEADGETFRCELGEALEAGGLREELLQETVAEREQLRGRIYRLQEEITQMRTALATSQSREAERIAEIAQLRSDRDVFLQTAMKHEIDKESDRRKIEILTEEAANARQREARACGELAGAFGRFAPVDRRPSAAPAAPASLELDEDAYADMVQVLGGEPR